MLIQLLRSRIWHRSQWEGSMANEAKQHLKVFLCHASQDKPAVRKLYKRLIAEGVDAWLDQESLLAGQDWREEIPRAVKASDVVVICLSNNSITKEGFVQTEITFALDIAKEKPEGTIFLIPTRLEECTVPDRLSRWHWVDLFNENGFEQLMRSLRSRAEKIGASFENASYADGKLAERIDQLYTDGLAAFWVEDWDKACYCFQTILRYEPNDIQASTKLEESKRQKILHTLYAQALDAQKNEDWNSMVGTLEKLTAEEPNYKEAQTLLKDAQKKNRLANLYEQARKLHKAEQWQAVVRIFEHIANIEPNYQDTEGILASAQIRVDELNRLKELNILYGRGVREIDSGNWFEAYELFKQIHNAEPHFLETERLLAKVETEVKKAEEKQWREDQIKILYEQARGLVRSQMWTEALNKIYEIRKINGEFADPDDIAKQAQDKLDQQEREIELQTKIASMYDEAVRLMWEKKYQDALEKWQEIVTLDPEHPDLQNVQLISKKRLNELAKAHGPRPRTVKTRLAWVASLVAITVFLITLFIISQMYPQGFSGSATSSAPAASPEPDSATSSGPVAILSPVPSVSSKLKPVAQLSVSSNRAPGLIYDIPKTGYYALEYNDGAWAAWEAPDSSTDMRWSTNLFCFHGIGIEWIGNAINGDPAIFVLSGGVYASQEEAKNASSHSRTLVYFVAGSKLSCMVADGSGAFRDNSGAVILTLYEYEP